MLFADDIVMVAESATKIQENLNELRDALEDNGLRISRLKTEYLYFPFEDEEAPVPDIYLEDQKLPNCSNFNYLGSTISRDASCENDVNHRVEIAWMK